MATVVDLANFTLTAYGPAENPYPKGSFTAAELDTLESQLKSRGFTLRRGFVESAHDGTFLRATRDSDGAVITIKIERK